MKKLLLCSLIALSPQLIAYDRITGADFASRSEVIASHAMAATSQPLATQIALDIMKQGGTAVDAAIAANALAIFNLVGVSKNVSNVSKIISLEPRIYLSVLGISNTLEA